MWVGVNVDSDCRVDDGPLNGPGQCSDPQLVPRPQEPKRDILYTIILYRTVFSR